MTIKQQQVINHFLTQYPEDWTFDQILEGIKNKSPEIIIWEPFEDYSREYVITKILEEL